jgi:thiamine-monophosphate kinase
MPESISDEDFENLYRSMNECAQRYGCRIVGGDLTASPVLVVSITVMGTGAGFLRSAARPGDIVIVTGDFGASALGLELILKGIPADAKESYVMKRHLRPEPRLTEGRILAGAALSQPLAMMDASDGLADALLQIAGLSGIAIEIDANKVPIHLETLELAVEMNLDSLELALYGGEDYELVACVSESDLSKLQKNGAAFKPIGRVLNGEGVSLLFNGKESIKLDYGKTFQHWKDSVQL